MNRKDVKRMTKDHDNPRSIAFTYKLILSLIAFFLIFMVAMVLGLCRYFDKDVWSALTSSAKGDKISIIREIRLPREVLCYFCRSWISRFWSNYARINTKSTCRSWITRAIWWSKSLHLH